MSTIQPPWKSYEALAKRVLFDLRRELGLSTVLGQQQLRGQSGTSWAVDGTATVDATGAILIIEARRHTTSGQKQENVAALAYRIKDLRGAGGILVSPLPLQRGASSLANHENITHVQIPEDSTPEHYMAQFLEQTFQRATRREGIALRDRFTAFVVNNGSPSEETASGPGSGDGAVD